MDEATMERVTRLEAKVSQLGRDMEYLLAAVAAANTRLAASEERQRRGELAASRGVR